MMKILNLKLVILFEYQNRKTFLQKAMSQTGLKKFKILCRGHMLLVILKENKLLEHFTKKNCKKKNQIKKRLELKSKNGKR